MVKSKECILAWLWCGKVPKVVLYILLDLFLWWMAHTFRFCWQKKDDFNFHIQRLWVQPILDLSAVFVSALSKLSCKILLKKTAGKLTLRPAIQMCASVWSSLDNWSQLVSTKSSDFLQHLLGEHQPQASPSSSWPPAPPITQPQTQEIPWQALVDYSAVMPARFELSYSSLVQDCWDWIPGRWPATWTGRWPGLWSKPEPLMSYARQRKQRKTWLG